jgi:protein-disulfide isomerase
MAPLIGLVRPVWSNHLSIRRALLAVVCLLSFEALASSALRSPFIDVAAAQSIALAMLQKPTALPEMALGSDKAPVTIIAYFSLTCPACAGFEENAFSLLQTNYIDTGKVRFIARDFPLDTNALAGATLVHCVATGDSKRYFAALSQLFILQPALISQPLNALQTIGHRFGMDDQAVEACIKDQALLNKLSQDLRFAGEVLKVEVAPTFFINGEQVKGAMTYEDLDKKLAPLVKR